MALDPKDRLNALLNQNLVNGIDFVEIVNHAQTQLNVHFLNKTAPIKGTVTSATITGGETIPTVAVQSFDITSWSTDSFGYPMLTLFVATPGDFSNYTLTLTSPRLDPYYSSVVFSFKAGCQSLLDCASPCTPCPPATGDMPPIDYLAKDFLSFRDALSDFSALRYPNWQERSEADFGVMFMESLCALADDLSYLQDRVHWEAYIETASQRRSLVRLARLVDYEPAPAVCASVQLQFDVTGGPIPAGIAVYAQAPDGSKIPFETGIGLADRSSYPVSPIWNRGALQPYFWDQSQECLLGGTSDLWMVGHGLGFYLGQSLLLDTTAPVPADPPIREIVTIGEWDELVDPLFINPATSQPYLITHVTLSAPLQYNHDLTVTTLAGNLVPATQALTYADTFAIPIPDGPQTSPAQMSFALARLGANHALPTPAYEYADGNFVANVSCSDQQANTAAWQYFYTLANTPLAWLTQPDPTQNPLPEIELSETDISPAPKWTYEQSLLDSITFESAYTLDPVTYTRVGTSSFDGLPNYEYDGDQGWTIRFGDGVFGQSPDPGATFRVRYRVGGGAAGNVAADTIQWVDKQSASPSAPIITSVTNPLPASGGQDMETNLSVQRLAPQAFQASQFRAVTAGDYEQAAKTLPWVLNAGTVFRWTGSWPTVFTNADPSGTETITEDQQIGLINLLNRYRLAGYESYAPAPVFVSVDLQITVCALDNSFRGDVENAILVQLSNKKLANGTTGFFYFDNFSFGAPLDPSSLEARIQNAVGVAGVVSVYYRRRGYTNGFIPLTQSIAVGSDQILRVDNDPSRPNSGTIQITVEGGK